MRPINLKMTAFGAYVKPTALDFESGLHDENLFLIHGATGSGKTTILDAICFALYGDKFTGDSETRNSKMMRSKGVGDNVDTEVEFTFALGKKIFKVLRVLQYFPNRKDKYALQSEFRCDKNLIETGASAVTKKIVELLGFNATQFRQVVLLPQGEFKKFLFANSDDRQKVLNILFDSTAYKKVEDMLGERAKTSAAEVDKLENRRETLTQQLQGTNNESISAVEEKVSEVQKKVDECQKIFDAAQSQLTDGKFTAAKFTELEQKLDALNTARNQLDEAEKLFEAAQTKYQQREAETDRRKNLEQKSRDLKQIKKLLDELTDKDEKLKSAQRALSEAQKNFSQCEDKAKRYEARLKQLTADKARLELEKIFGEISKLRADLIAAQEKVSAAKKNLESAQIKLTRLQIVDKAAQLASTLKDGEPCPVCGSREHPAVIKAATPTVDELRDADNQVKRLTDEKDKIERIASRIEGALHAKEKQLQEHAGTPEFDAAKKSFISAEKTAADLADCLKRIEKGNDCIADNKNALDDANDKKNSASEAVARLEGEIQRLKKEVPEIYLTDAARLDTDLSAAQREFNRLNDAWDAAQKNFNNADKNKSARTETVKNLQNDCDKLNGSLKGKTPPDIAALTEKARVADDNLKGAISEKATLENILRTLKNFSAELDDVIKKLAEAQKIADMWRGLSDVANATGKGESELKISFQRYFLSTMFNDVVTEANNRLKKMSGGRYLFQMKDAGKTLAKSAGLNLQIFDDYTGTTRPVETLSGGESFLASLSLALGLAAVVQNNSGGINLDTIFIDEGFGTLDSETLDFAMKTLLELQSGGRLVGIISHVEELKNQMPVRLEVFKTKTGSEAKFIS